MYKDRDKCPICGEGNLTEISKTEIFEYKRQYKTIDNFIVLKCSFCEEEIVPETSIKLSEKKIRDFHREVDGLLTSKQIKKIRESYGFTQDSFSEILGVGKKTFARYENCTVTQSRTADHLLRVIEVFPDVLDIICEQPVLPSNYNFEKLSSVMSVPADQNLVYNYKIGA